MMIKVSKRTLLRSNLLVWALVLLAGCGSSETISYGPANNRLRPSNQPSNKIQHRDLKTEYETSLTPIQATIRTLPIQLEQLSRKIEQHVRRVHLRESLDDTKLQGDITQHLPYAGGANGTKPLPKKPINILTNDFKASGMDRRLFSNTFFTDEIRVARWRYNKSAPEFSKEPEANFKKLIDSCYAPWTNARDFRIELSAYSSKMGDRVLNVDLVAEAFGRPTKEKGRQATAIWSTEWSIDDARQKLELQSVTVKAQEEVLSLMPGGMMFTDATASILKNCKSLKSQLNFGLDQWAQVIPGVDVMGRQGIAVGDINSDGYDDIYLCQGHGLPNLLLVQNPNGTVEDVSHEFGVDLLDESLGALMIDVDNDGDQDLVVSTDENLVLMSNKGVDADGKCKFQMEHAMSIGRGAHSISSADYDQDGDLDLFLCKYQPVQKYNDFFPQPNSFSNARNGGRNVLLRNDEGWTFTDVTSRVGLSKDNHDYTQSAVWTDYDFDGDQDLYIANSFSEDVLLENRDNWFSASKKKLPKSNTGKHNSVSVGDFNQDGRLDFFVASDLSFDTLLSVQQNQRLGAEISPSEKMLLDGNHVWYGNDEELNLFPLRTPLFTPNAAFGSVAADFNNDGRDDIVMTNGLLTRRKENVDWLLLEKAYQSDVDESEQRLQSTTIRPLFHEVSDLCRMGYSYSGRQRNRCYLSIGQSGFANYGATAGIDFPDDARAVATTDWDRDGDIDLVISCRTAPQLRILLNQMPANNDFLVLDLEGLKSNRDSIGARVSIFLEGKKQPITKQIGAGSGNLSQSSKRLSIGLGPKAEIQRAVISWPSGEQQTFKLTKNSHYRLVEGQPEPAEQNLRPLKIPISPRLNPDPNRVPDVKRSVFYPPSELPEMEFQSEEKWYPVENIDKLPLLVVMCNDQQPSGPFLRALARDAQKMADNNVDVLGLYVESEISDERSIYSAAKKTFTESEFPFRWGAASAASLHKLEFAASEWFSDQSIPTAPFAILLDPRRRVRSIYRADEFDPQQVIDDLPVLKSPDYAYRAFASPMQGIWAERYRQESLLRLRTRLSEVGYHQDAERFDALTQAQKAAEICHRAYELESIGDKQKSVEFFEEAIKTDPNCVIAYVGEAKLLQQMSARQVDRNLKTQMLREAELNFASALEIDPLNTEAILGRATVAIQQRNVAQAIEQLEEYLEIDPKRYEVHAVIGRLFFQQADHAAATKHFSIAFDNRPSLPYVAGDLGKVYLINGKFELARGFFEYAVNLQPSDINLQRLHADAEFMTGNFERSVTLMKRVVETQPTKRRPKEIFAWLLATCPYESYRDGVKATEIVKPMLKLFEQESPSVLEIAAAAFAEAGDFEQALAYQRSAMELLQDPDVTERYTEKQKIGLESRMELYQRERPYRMDDLEECPIKEPGR